MNMKSLYLLIAFAPLVGSLITGLFGWAISRRAAHVVTVLGVALSVALSCKVLYVFMAGKGEVFNSPIYTWLMLGGYKFSVGFLVDSLTAMMMVVITIVSLMVHVYSIGYMHDDPGYQRFFSYLSLFTFSMLMLVMSNNFIQLFFGWEAVGLVSYLLIGFWFKRPTAIYASLKAFLVNRVGDFGFLLGIGLILTHFGGSLNYSDVFAAAPGLSGKVISLFPGVDWSLMSVTCILLFVGAMGKSAQFPLHVWLPDSMEGPTPISALIHAATMVTAGIFMVSRMSPLFELSDTALNVIMVFGSITALFMGFIGVVQNDIKRVVAYSTLSQLGYMTVALGASAYSLAMFHVMTHAFFKALLFLAAGSVIIGMHHHQDMRKMGGLHKYMPITCVTSLLGTLSLIGAPFCSGFYSKDSIIEAVRASNLPASGFAYFALITGVFVTALYSFRMYFLVFHGKERWIEHHDVHPKCRGAKDEEKLIGDYHPALGQNEKPRESPWIVTLPLVLLAIPSILIGYFAIEPILHGDFFLGVITVNHALHPAMAEITREFQGAAAMGIHSLSTLPFWFAVGGILTAWCCSRQIPKIPVAIKQGLNLIKKLLEQKYYLDAAYFVVFANGSRALGTFFWKIGDMLLIDGLLVDGVARLVARVSRATRRLQTGFIYSYAMAMIIGVLAFLTLWFFPLIWR